MTISTPYFLGSSLHCNLGANISHCVDALREPVQAPGLFLCDTLASVEPIPYKPLHGFSSLGSCNKKIYQIIDSVVQQVIDEVQLTDKQLQNMALFVGSSSFDISVSEYLYQQEQQNSANPLPLRLSSFGNVAAYIRRQFSLNGADYSYNTACTSSANALIEAGKLLRLGVIEHALVVSVELYNDTTALGFQGLDLLTCSMMKPFDCRRDGLVLGEACSALILGNDKSQAANSKPFFLCGGANRCDTYSISASNPDGSTIAQVIKQAMADTSVAAQDIHAVKIHGTASLSNDEAEIAGILSVFDSIPPLCALKPFIGHTLGACGLTEIILFYRAIDRGFLPATPGIGVGKNALGIPLNQNYSVPANGYFMLNYFGFGGNNSSVIIANS